MAHLFCGNNKGEKLSEMKQPLSSRDLKNKNCSFIKQKGQKIRENSYCEEAAAGVPAGLIAEAKANIEPRLRAANHFYTWMEIVVVDARAHNQIFYHFCPLSTEFSLKKCK